MRPPDSRSAMPLAASFFSATQRIFRTPRRATSMAARVRARAPGRGSHRRARRAAGKIIPGPSASAVPAPGRGTLQLVRDPAHRLLPPAFQPLPPALAAQPRELQLPGCPARPPHFPAYPLRSRETALSGSEVDADASGSRGTPARVM